MTNTTCPAPRTSTSRLARPAAGSHLAAARTARLQRAVVR